ncbi:MAG: Holliday junction branch migration DNA helicase RuvB, partial [Dehalococcoidia bacterium]|nr:Holliday junction branch migration DNA helicase RuvB [Dehalococcoidia bacterium]
MADADDRPGPLTPVVTDEDVQHETSLRPRRLEQYFGQERI